MDCISSIENSLLMEILKATGQILIGTLIVLGVWHLLLRSYCCKYMLMSTVKFSMESWNMTGRILSGDQVSVMVLPGENSKLEEMMSTLCPLSGESA